MCRRIAGVSIIRVVLVLAAVVAGVACDDKNSPGLSSPAAPTAATASASGTILPASAAITCSARLSRPGDACQLTMTVTFSDGSTRDVTADARWGYGGAVIVSPSGLVTARSYGIGQVIHNAYQHLQPNPMEVRVLPEGTFIVTGRVTEGGGFKLADARVSASSAFGAATATSGDDGRFVLAPVSGDAVLRVEKDGYAGQERTVNVQRDEVANFEVVRRDPAAGNIGGVYTLTFTAAPSCALPAEFMRRTYLARITGQADDLLVELDGPGFPEGWYLYGFRGRREGTAVSFDIHGTPGDPVADYDYIFTEDIDGACSMLQPCAPGHRYLSFKGMATGSIGDRSIPTVFSGMVLLYTGTGTLAQCTGDHRLEFSR